MTKRRGSLTKSLTVERITSLADAETLAPEWNALAEQGTPSPFALPALALPWWRHLGKGKLRIVTVRSTTGELFGVAPFHERRLAGLDIVRPLGHGVGAIASTLTASVKADVGGLLLNELLAGPRTVLDAADMRLDDALVRSVRRTEQFAFNAVLHDECPVIDLTGVASATELLAQPSHKPLRQQLAKADRALESQSVTVDVATSPAETVAAFDAVMGLYGEAETDRPRLHMGLGAHGAFFREALEGLAKLQQVAFLTLLVDGEPAAFDVYVISPTEVSAIVGRYRPSMAEWSPGHLLLRAGVDWAISTGVDTLDLQLGSDRYKTLWSTHSLDTFSVNVSPPALMGLARTAVAGVESAYKLRSIVGKRLAR